MELSLIEDQEVIQAFPTNAPEKPFTCCIGSRRMIGRSEEFDVASCCHTSKAGAELAIAIADQIRWYLPYPGVGRGSCHSYMNHPPRLELDDEKSKERMKKEIGHLQEVTGPDLGGVIAQKSAPLLPSWLRYANVSHVLLDGPLAHVHAEFQEFSTNPLSTPEPIHRCYLLDQCDSFCSDLRRVRSGP